MDSNILFILISLFFLAFFTVVELVFISRTKFKIEPDKKQNQFRLFVLSKLNNGSKQFTITILVGKIASFVFFGILIANQIKLSYNSHPVPNSIVLIALQILISISIIFIIWELLPKILYQFNHNKIARFLTIPTFILYILLFPVGRLTLVISSVFFSLFGLKGESFQEKILFTQFESENNPVQVLSESDSESELEHDIKLFQNALDFSKVKLRECTIPRNEIAAIEINSPIEKLKEKFIETGYSKILVYKETIDHIIGYAQSSDLFQNPENISAMLKNIIIAPETMAANNLLNLFMKEHKSMALVVDEFGGTAGIVTIEDIMEEIFGEIEDEHDSSDFREEKLSDTEFIFSGRLEIDYLNEKFDLNFPESEDYETIAGYILHHHEEIPNENDKFRISKFEFEILKMQNPKIELVKVKIVRK